MFAWVRRLLRRSERRVIPTIAADTTGFSLTLGRHTHAYPWASVRKVAAYKQDLHTHDVIVLVLEVFRAANQVLTLLEEDPGFATLFAPMEEALGINPSWYLEIMTPVFAATPVVLYVRDPEGDEVPPIGSQTAG